MSTQLERRVTALEKAVGVDLPGVESMEGFDNWASLFVQCNGGNVELAREATRAFFERCRSRGEQPSMAAMAVQAAEDERAEEARGGKP